MINWSMDIGFWEEWKAKKMPHIKIENLTNNNIFSASIQNHISKPKQKSIRIILELYLCDSAKSFESVILTNNE